MLAGGEPARSSRAREVEAVEALEAGGVGEPSSWLPLIDDHSMNFIFL